MTCQFIMIIAQRNTIFRSRPRACRTCARCSRWEKSERSSTCTGRACESRTSKTKTSSARISRFEAKYPILQFSCCREAKKQAYVYAALFAMSQSITYVLYSVAFRYGSYLVLEGEMTPSAVYRSVERQKKKNPLLQTDQGAYQTSR